MPTFSAQTKPDVFLERGEGTLVRKKGICVVHLQGSYADMGRQHAELANAVCGDVVFRYMDGIIARLVAHAVPSLAGPIAGVLKRWFHWRNRGALDGDL